MGILGGVCPPDLFERLCKRIHDPREYSQLIAEVLDLLCQRSSEQEITWQDGIPYIEDPYRKKFISTFRPNLTTGWYGLNQKNRYLRMAGGVTTGGNAGYLVPRKAVITGLWAKSRSNSPWAIEVRRNNNPITLASVNIIGSFGKDLLLDVDVDEGDFLQFYLAGTGVDHPIASMEMAWRLT